MATPSRAARYRQPPSNIAAADAPDNVPTEVEEVRLADVGWAGLTAARAVEDLLGPLTERRSGDPAADCVAALQAADEWLRLLDLRRAVLLHALYQILLPDNSDVWLRIAQMIGHKKSTVYMWAYKITSDRD